jgi:hypothetical protein
MGVCWIEKNWTSKAGLQFVELDCEMADDLGASLSGICTMIHDYCLLNIRNCMTWLHESRCFFGDADLNLSLLLDAGAAG